MVMDQKNFYKNEVYHIEKWIQDQFMDFNGEIMVLNIKTVILIIKIKELINYNK